MTRRDDPFDNADDSDVSYSPDDEYDSDELFDRNEADSSDAETEATDADLDLDGNTKYANVDVEDQIQLFGGNVHSPEHYRQAVEEFNDIDYETQDYSDGSLLLLDACEEQWRQYATTHVPSILFLLLTSALFLPTGTARFYGATLKNALSPSRSPALCGCSITSSTGGSTKRSAKMAGRCEEPKRAAPWVHTGKYFALFLSGLLGTSLTPR